MPMAFTAHGQMCVPARWLLITTGSGELFAAGETGLGHWTSVLVRAVHYVI